MLTLKQLRIRLALSQTEMGERLGVSASMLSQWESDYRTPSTPTLMRIVTEFGCTAHITENGVRFLPEGEWMPPPSPLAAVGDKVVVDNYRMKYDSRDEGTIRGIQYKSNFDGDIFRWYYEVWIDSKSYKVVVGDEGIIQNLSK